VESRKWRVETGDRSAEQTQRSARLWNRLVSLFVKGGMESRPDEFPRTEWCPADVGRAAASYDLDRQTWRSVATMGQTQRSARSWNRLVSLFVKVTRGREGWLCSADGDRIHVLRLVA